MAIGTEVAALMGSDMIHPSTIVPKGTTVAAGVLEDGETLKFPCPPMPSSVRSSLRRFRPQSRPPAWTHPVPLRRPESGGRGEMWEPMFEGRVHRRHRIGEPGLATR